MSVSVIIPTLNEADSLRTHLPVLLATAGVQEVIVADGGSNDASIEVVTTLGAQLVCSTRGRAQQMNAGAAAASGDVLLFLHADTQLPEHGIALVDRAVASGALWGRFDLRLSGQHGLLRVVERLINWRSCLTGIATGDQAIFLRRDQFEAIGGYADIPLMEDVELSTRLRHLQWPRCIHHPPVNTSSRRWEHYGIMRTIFLMWRLRLAYFLGASPHSLARRYRRSDTAGQGS